MTRTRLQLDTDQRTEKIRQRLAEDLQRLREDAGASRSAVARSAGIDRSVVAKIERGILAPTLETYGRVAAALGADFAARIYPQSGPAIRDRHQVPMAELVLGSLHARWSPAPEVAVRRPVRGWIDLVLHDPLAHALVATELESSLRRIEQLLRWSTEKALALPSSNGWRDWLDGSREPEMSRLLVVRWTRANREAAAEARRMLREAYPADPRDALEALTGTAAWPGPAMIWARLDKGGPRLDDGLAGRRPGQNPR